MELSVEVQLSPACGLQLQHRLDGDGQVLGDRDAGVLDHPPIGVVEVVELVVQRQADVRRELSLLGYEVVEAESNFRDLRLDMTGSIDGKIILPVAGHHHRYPVEIKSVQSDGPATEWEWQRSESDFLRNWYTQLQDYLFLTATEGGFGLFKNKQNGLWTVCAVMLDYAFMEDVCQRAK
jgi:hypothetical protein